MSWGSEAGRKQVCQATPQQLAGGGVVGTPGESRAGPGVGTDPSGVPMPEIMA